jgi:hypothetical protein
MNKLRVRWIALLVLTACAASCAASKETWIGGNVGEVIDSSKPAPR